MPPNKTMEMKNASPMSAQECDSAPEPAVQNAQSEVSEGKPWRLTVRLPDQMAELLRAKCRESDQTPSQLVRSALIAALRVDESDEEAMSDGMESKPSRPSREFPSALLDLLPKYRCFGGRLWPERRRLFHALLAAAQVAQENGENPQDLHLRNELVRLGKRFGLM
jgi:hypothetical protein